jgi:prepilin signal peptidase PulO-like enzyme (type II secretory pathway)
MIILFSFFWGSFWALIIDRYIEYFEILKNKKTLTYCSYQRLNRLYLKKVFLGQSRCESCYAPISWYLNIPIVSFLMLGGRTKCCHQIIPKHLFLSEVCFLLMGVVNYYFVPNSLEQFVLLFAFSILILISVLDWRFMLIPDGLSYLLLWFGLLFSLFYEQAFLLPAMLGAVFAYLALKLLQLFYASVLRKNALGDADPLLAAAIASWVGADLLPYFFLGSSALAILLILFFRKKDDWTSKPFPFGPSLAFIGGTLIGYRFIS